MTAASGLPLIDRKRRLAKLIGKVRHARRTNCISQKFSPNFSCPTL
jgi:hypothetical protein